MKTGQSSVRLRRCLGAGLLGTALVLLLPDWGDSTDTARHQGVVLARAETWPPPLPDSLRAAPAAKALLPLSNPPAAMPVQTAATATFDLCGLGRISAPAGSAPDIAAGGLDALPGPLGQHALQAARERMMAQLQAGPPRARVAALLLSPPADEDELTRRDWAQHLLQLALSSQDAVALRWAEEACGLTGDGPACRLSLIRARLRLEPDNGLHWAALADEDPAAADEAWQGLRQARRWHDTPKALTVLAQAALPADVPPYLRLALGAEIGTREAALPTPGEGYAQERCRDSGGARRAECDALARLLVQGSDSTQALSQGRRVAQASGWPAAQLQALDRELRALASPAAQWQVEAAQPLSCHNAQRWQGHLADVAASGELQALRKRLGENAGLLR